MLARTTLFPLEGSSAPHLFAGKREEEREKKKFQTSA
jgi:hypothetical protein